MGRLHARALERRASREGDVCLAWVVDRHAGRARAVTGEFGGQPSDDLSVLETGADAAVVAVPTASHAEVAERLLEADLDVLVEKPIASGPSEARALVETARRRERILGVGHVEWLNPLLVAARNAAGRAMRIEVDRLNPPSERGLDVDVIQDLMLHDLDWVARWIGEPLAEIEAETLARGAAGIDEAVAELRFEGGASARLLASRIHAEPRRLVTVAGSRADVTVDLVRGSLDGEESPRSGDGVEPLDLVWSDFLSACASRRAPDNSGAAGVAALELVDRVRAAATKRDGS